MKHLITIVIPEVPASANHPIDDELNSSGTHSRRADFKQLRDYKQRWEKKVKMYKLENDVPDLNGKKVEIKFRFYFDKGRKRDHDNYYLAMKGMIDGLFKEDDSEWVRCNFPDFLIDKANPRTEMEIQEL